jgi:predicted nucleic acid-binding protein
MLLVDSAFYISRLREGTDVRLLLEPWSRAGRLCSCGPIRAEVLRGIRHADLKRDLEEFFSLNLDIPTDDRLWREVAELAWLLDRRGTVLPLTDLVIACCALNAAATVISPDPHFDDVPGLSARTELPPGLLA